MSLKFACFISSCREGRMADRMIKLVKSQFEKTMACKGHKLEFIGLYDFFVLNFVINIWFKVSLKNEPFRLIFILAANILFFCIRSSWARFTNVEETVAFLQRSIWGPRNAYKFEQDCWRCRLLFDSHSRIQCNFTTCFDKYYGSTTSNKVDFFYCFVIVIIEYFSLIYSIFRNSITSYCCNKKLKITNNSLNSTPTALLDNEIKKKN